MKYRIWNTKSKCFICPLDYLIDGAGNVYYHDLMDGEVFKLTDECIFQRGSGVFDKNNKEIFEGDKVKFKTRDGYDREILEWAGVVRFEAGLFLFSEHYHTMVDRIVKDSLEIVGNIFE